MTALTQAIDKARKRIATAAISCQRDSAAITLIVVSKKRTAIEIRRAYEYGVRDFAESYCQEAIEKIKALHDCAITWHFIGPIQSNKTRLIASHFAWVHSVGRLKIARRLSEQRSPDLPPLQLCLQINISAEATKSGFMLEQLMPAAVEIAALPNIKLCGLMAIPARSSSPQQPLRDFTAVAAAQQQLIERGYKLDVLSMGMSADLEAAIQAGATMVRIGTAIFGERK